MASTFRRIAPLTLAAFALVAGPAVAAPARTVEVNATETKTWDGAQATGLNWNYFNLGGAAGATWSAPGQCTTDVRTYCDTTLVKVTNPVPETDADGRLSRKATVTISDYAPVPDPANDYDLLAFKSDENGTQGAELARDGDTNDTANETVTFNVATTTAKPTEYVLVQVVYFATINSSYKGTFKF